MDSLLLLPLDQRPRPLEVWTRHRRGQQELAQEQLSAVDQDVRAALAAALSERSQSWLPAALAELYDCAEEAREEGYPEPSERSQTLAEAILRRIARLPVILPEPSVYPSADNEIVLFFCRGDAQAAVSISIDADGGGACFSNVGGLRRARDGNVSAWPDAFVRAELLKLGRLAPAD